jgi:hypothetical protein
VIRELVGQQFDLIRRAESFVRLVPLPSTVLRQFCGGLAQHRRVQELLHVSPHHSQNGNKSVRRRRIGVLHLLDRLEDGGDAANTFNHFRMAVNASHARQRLDASLLLDFFEGCLQSIQGLQETL